MPGDVPFLNGKIIDGDNNSITFNANSLTWSVSYVPENTYLSLTEVHFK